MVVENNHMCPVYGRSGDVEDHVLLSSINARLRIVEKQANATDARVTQLEKDVDPERLDDEIAKVKKLISEEAASRLSATTTLSGNIAAETSERKQKDDVIEAAATAESTARANGDAVLSASITTEAAARAGLGAKVDTEVLERKEADTSLNAAIQSLATVVDTDREVLSDEIDDVRDDSAQLVANEKTARAEKDSQIDESIAAEIARAKAAEVAESKVRSDADANEVVLRESADTILANRIAAEESARVSTDSNLALETTNRTTADTSLGDRITAEVTTRTSEDARILEEAKSYADTVGEKVFRFRGTKATYAELQAIADAKTGDVYFVTEKSACYGYTVVGSWDKISSVVDLSPYALKTEVTEEKARAEGKEQELANAIDAKAEAASSQVVAEKNRAVAAESGLQGAIESEATSRGALGTTLRGLISDEASSRSSAISAEHDERVASDATEKHDRETEDASIRADFASADAVIDAKVVAADERITTEKTSVLAMLDNTALELDEKITLEKQERKASDAELGTKIDNLTTTVNSLVQKFTADGKLILTDTTGKKFYLTIAVDPVTSERNLVLVAIE